MLPSVLFYDNYMIQTINPFNLNPLSNNSQLFSFPPSTFFVNSSDLYFSTIGQQQMDTSLLHNNYHVKHEIQSQVHDSQKKQKTEEKPVKRVQNPYRNIYTNITNLILNFIISKKKIGELLFEIDPTLVDQKLYQFYKYVKNIKKYFCSYFNIEKVKKLFHCSSIPNYNKQFHMILRIAARKILQQKISICIITSKKLCPQLRMQHLNAKRVVLNILKDNKRLDKVY